MDGQLTLDARNQTTESLHELKPKITVIGIGGAGGNAVNNMIRYQLEGVDFIVGNTDAQALVHSLAPHRIQLGLEITQGLGAGSRPDVGKAAAEESVAEVMSKIKGSHMVFITAGMGGGTGTGAAPVIAKAAREAGILTVGVVTKPFHFEGSHRMKSAERGIADLQQYVDTLIVIPNQNLFRVANERTTFADAFKMADDVLYSGVRGVTDLMIMPGLINLDFADIRSVMGEMGKAMMGTGEAEGENRAVEAAEAAISNPLLDDVSMRGARGVLINITGGYDMTLFEVDEAANRIRQEVDPDANIIFGSTFDEKMEGVIRVSVVATGIDAEMTQQRAAAIRASSNAIPDVITSNTSEDNQEEASDPYDDELTATTQKTAEDAHQLHDEAEDDFAQERYVESYRPVRKLSFFERLTGRHKAPTHPEDKVYEKQMPSRMKSKVKAEDDLNLDDSEELEIPAFLRRKK
jgi:cell division protein FtsZ